MNTRLFLSSVVLATGGALLLGPNGFAAPQNGTESANPQTQNQQMQNQQMRNREMQNQEMQNQEMHNRAEQSGSHSDKAFVKKANESNNAEIQLGNLALQKSDNQQVKQFAQKMVNDHTNLNEEMKPVAEQLGVQPTDAIPSSARKLKNKLQGLSGSQFDEVYIRAMLKDHKKDIHMVQRAASRTKDQQLKQTAEKAEQVMKGHLQDAEQVARSLNIHGAQASLHK